MRIVLTLIISCSFLIPFAQTSTSGPRGKNPSSTQVALASNAIPTGTPAELKRKANEFQQAGQIDSAIIYLQQVVSKQHTDIAAQLQLGALYQLNEQFDMAIQQFDVIIGLKSARPHPAAFYGKARAYFALEQYAEALRNSEIAMRWYLMAEEFLSAAEARLLSGQSYMHLGMYQEAIKYFKASKKHFKNRPFYHYYIGYSYLNLNKLKEAKQYLVTAEEMGYQVPSYVKARIE